MIKVDNTLLNFLSRNRMNLHDYVYLWTKYTQTDLNLDSVQVNEPALLLSGYISETGTITDKGITLIRQSFTSEIVETSSNADFKRWWEAFPANDGHGLYEMTRALRIREQECLVLFTKIIQSGITLEELLQALDSEVTSRKIRSLDQNELKYMPNSYNYLLGEYFKPWIRRVESDNPSNDRDKFKLI